MKCMHMISRDVVVVVVAVCVIVVVANDNPDEPASCK